MKELSVCKDGGGGLNLGGKESLWKVESWQILYTASPPPRLLPGDHSPSALPSLLLISEAG